MADQQPSRPPWMKLSGIGIEFAAAVGGFALVGFWVDLKFQTKPWGVLIGAVLGLTGATYNLIKASMAAFKESDAQYKKDRTRDKS